MTVHPSLLLACAQARAAHIVFRLPTLAPCPSPPPQRSRTKPPSTSLTPFLPCLPAPRNVRDGAALAMCSRRVILACYPHSRLPALPLSPAAVTFPLDIIKTRLQAQGETGAWGMPWPFVPFSALSETLPSILPACARAVAAAPACACLFYCAVSV